MHCPRCEAPMREMIAGGTRLCGCPSCGGVWLFVEESARLAQAFPLEAVQLAEAAEKATARVDTKTALHCPTCKEVLQRSRFRATATGFTFVAEGERPRATELVELDVCARDGTFFDGGELPRAARAIHVARNNGPGQYLTHDEPEHYTTSSSYVAFDSSSADAAFDLFGMALMGAFSLLDD